MRRTLHCTLWVLVGLLLALFLFVVAEAGVNVSTGTLPTDTRWPTATAMRATPTPRPHIMPCTPGNDLDREWVDTVRSRLRHWKRWLEGEFGEQYVTRLPVEIPLSIIAHESRGAAGARGAAGEVGLFQILPQSSYAGRPPSRHLDDASENIRYGVYLLERVAWYGRAHVLGLDPTYYELVPEANRTTWWYTPEGRAALAIYNCGVGAYPRGDCAYRGGDYYANEVLTCWVPWVRENVLDQWPSEARYVHR